MSGGCFNYNQHYIKSIGENIELYADTNSEKNEWGESRDYPREVIERFRLTAQILQHAYDLVREADWLLSGDTGVDTFMPRTDEAVQELLRVMEAGHVDRSLEEE